MNKDSLSLIKLVAFDIDGVFTDGRFYLSDTGVESKAFSTQDGYGIRMLIDSGIYVAVISGRKSNAVAKRMLELGVTKLVESCVDKVAALNDIAKRLDIQISECAYVGDDMPDLPLLNYVGFSIAVANAVPELHAKCDYSTSASGGFGAVREVCELILEAQNKNK
ncbi:MAG: HAD family hydrolase [Gammaproteobacteria bacterium]|nr:HAD family hydrolase [Gammaproteobacteria bacterium]|tara:strand:- start:15464 stop:15958 length:495 start_codon:yes stop_codon:yes gene_type:complete